MEFLCEDLPQHGLILVPPASPDYESLLADIQARVSLSTEGAPPIPERFRPRISEQDRSTSAILLNKSPKAIAAMQVVWQFETATGRSYSHSRGMLSAQNLLLPFGRQDASWAKIFGYWQTILPGSKRYLSESGMIGDNTDVRPPAADEKWRGGVVMGGGRGGGTFSDPVKQITLVLDGVFFLDGEFVGPDSGKLFERTVADAGAHLTVAKIAQDAHNNGLTPTEILGEIEKVTGPATEFPALDLVRNPDATPEEFRQAALKQIASQLTRSRQFPQGSNDERTVYMVMAWAQTVLPQFRKG